MSLVPQVLVMLNDLPQPAIDLLMKENFEVTVMDNPWANPEEVLKLIQNYDAVLGKFHVDSKFLDQAGKRLKVISTPSAAYDHLDVPEIKKRGIKVGYTPQVLSTAVAELAIFLIIGTLRRTHEMRLLLEQGKIKQGFQWMLGQDLRNKVVGIVGLGSIGQTIAKKLIPFEVQKILYTDHSKMKEEDNSHAEFASQDRLLKESDVVINCLPLSSQTKKMFNDKAFGKMKSTAVFINVGRGETVDTEALVQALKDKQIYAAGLDVTDPEPLPVDHDLLHLPNVVVVPHIGSQTIETRNDMAIVAAQNVINGLKGKPLLFEL